MSDCIFCKIAAHEIGAQIVYEDDEVMAFEDANPQLPVHTLIIPKAHYAHIGDAVPPELLGQLFSKVGVVAGLKGVDGDGYRVVVNTGEDGRQTVHHLHIHVLGGAQMPIRMGPAD
ncbi:MAG: histidine triad nucleotide-binding protein [Coriobacteriales bacterium]|jgi:histidine triad (HIT) family protein|nr:histidine triad nucleotide-binding protein [Coriobacteriales bacterium]